MDEVIDHAQLRLYTLVQRDRSTYVGVDRKVSVLEMLSQRRDVPENTKYRQLSSRHVYGQNSGWEAFDVTSAVKRWVSNFTHVQILEVRIESVFHGGSHGNMDIDTDPTHKNEPLLVVFSNDLQKERLHDTEIHELIRHESDIKESKEVLNRNIKLPMVQHAASGSSRVSGDSSASHSIVKRSKKNRRNSCRRKPMYVNFQDINWHEWILIPTGYQAFECVGRCYIPMNHHLTPTKHAIIQTLMHTTKIGRTGRACCVPTKLDPISVLYLDENDVITYKYRYDEMIVAECGCR
ncbi:bone morphogenetic protein 10-like [Gigantopelta aegis]|uniref:bone morphogenetic protein 10-like n=1 Tax=Gigantopelta aegis TaxID=1735272 RepID=UPI001B88CF18|nr:bone morphogenetic protein 10-like [Gigantopelta aegis]